MPIVFNKNLDKIPAGAVYVGRGSPWGNPFVIGPDGSRNDVCNKYQLMVEKNPKLKARIKSQLAGKIWSVSVNQLGATVTTCWQ